MNIKYFLIFYLFFLIIPCLGAQDYSVFDCSVIQNGIDLENPFAGGLDAPQFNQMDLNGDDIEDLIVYDRISKLVSIYIYDAGEYLLNEEYTGIFPYVEAWILLRDYNGDGIKDLFISPAAPSSPSVEVWKGSKYNGAIRFEKLDFPYGNGDVISYYYFGYYYGVYVSKPDIPAIIDVDFDGDLDVLSFESGGGTINYYRNLCVEEGLSLDSFKLELADRCWGKFRESVYNEDIILSEDPGLCASSSGGLRHAESTVNLLDIDGDLDFDVLLGDSEYKGLIFIENGGNGSAWGTYIERGFPAYDTPADLRWLLASYNIDVDQDGQMDLLVSPNAQFGSENYNNVLYYRDVDPGTRVNFSFIQNDFIVDQMIDWGSKVYPVFVDYDQDGLQDLLLGMSGLIDGEGMLDSRLILYRNTGTYTDPVFELIDEDYFNFSSYDESFLAPGVGDLDGDGDMDLVLGTNEGKLIFCQNMAGAGNLMQFDTPIFDYMDIDVGYNALPTIFDVDNDGLADLVVGNNKSYSLDGETGSLAFFKNQGTIGYPLFYPSFIHPGNIIPWGGILLQKNNFNLSSWARPTFFEKEDKAILFVGGIRGTVNVYDQIREQYEGELHLLYDSLAYFDIGEFSAPAVADIDNDSYLEILIGTQTGGLKFYNTDIYIDEPSRSTAVAIGQLIGIVPNPANTSIHFDFNISGVKRRQITVKIYNQMGQLLLTKTLSGKSDQIDISTLSVGVYTGLAFDTEKFYVGKFIKR